MNDQRTFWQRYYGQLEGAKITRVELGAGEFPGEFWPKLTVELDPQNPEIKKLGDFDDLTIVLEVSQDEEGNGPGFIFGLAIPAK